MSQNRLSTGVRGLDQLFHGGLLANQTYLVRGGPGSGKTTLGLHFLSAGQSGGEQTLLITLVETEQKLRRNATAMGFNLEEVSILDLSPNPELFTQSQTYDIFSPAEVEREPITQQIIEQVESIRPQRVFVDSITQFRYLATDSFQFRRQVTAFLEFLVNRNITVLLSSEFSQEAPDEDLQFIIDGILNLEFSPEERSLNVSKFRGSEFRKGRHTLQLSARGMEVFPRLIPQPYGEEISMEVIPSGIPEIDELLEGGLERGTVTLFTGPSGVGKTSLGMQFIKESAGRGERSVVYLFEEARETLLRRCESINIPVRAMIERGTLSVVKLEPLTSTPDEFANQVRQEVEEQDSKIIMIDSIAGYQLSFQKQELTRNLHSLCKYLQSQGITTILINEVETITGDFRATELGISYLADNIIFLRYLEFRGQIRKTIGVLKKRLSNFEKTMRELEITRYGIKVGNPLTKLRGILTGTPELIDTSFDDH
ncbi:MAG: AAA family ATPase [Cyanothece sp. SIO1E1]|nr:AAA family ATPase [Cyanothece sp. SIO1E1]